MKKRGGGRGQRVERRREKGEKEDGKEKEVLEAKKEMGSNKRLFFVIYWKLFQVGHGAFSSGHGKLNIIHFRLLSSAGRFARRLSAAPTSSAPSGWAQSAPPPARPDRNTSSCSIKVAR